MEVNKESPAELAGLEKNQVITKLDGREIKTGEEFMEYLTSLAEEKDIVVDAGAKQYIITPKKDEAGKYKMGVSIVTAYCKK